MLRNREEKEETKLHGVDLVSEDSDLELGSFTFLQNWIPSSIFSVVKKRGVAVLSTTPITPTIPGFDIHPFMLFIPSAFNDVVVNHPHWQAQGKSSANEISHPFLTMGM